MNPTSATKGPSKQFLIRGGIAVGIIVIILFTQTAWFRGLFHKKTKAGAPVVVGDLIAKDSNGNGIPDWEERLWGLDPTVLYTKGTSNVDIIHQKKLAVGIKDSNSDAPLTDTDQIAQSLFSLSMAVGDSGADSNTANATIADAASKIGASVEIHSIYSHYLLKDLKTVKTSAQSLRTYQASIAAILATYDNNTADINVVVQALQTGDFSNLGQLTTAAATYRDFAQRISKLSAPIGVAQYQLDMMNGFYGMADSFQYLVLIQDDSLQGLSGIVAYRKYDLMLETAASNMHDYFVVYGIIPS